MTDYRNENDPRYVDDKSHTGNIVTVTLLIAIVIVGLLFATGAWSTDVTGGSVPKVATQKPPIDGPTVGLKDDSKK